jgi:hypothetical protein
LSRRIQKLAVEVHRAVGCEGYSRVDFMCDDEGPKIIEVNTAPGMTGTSLLPQGAQGRGDRFPSPGEDHRRAFDETAGLGPTGHSEKARKAPDVAVRGFGIRALSDATQTSK